MNANGRLACLLNQAMQTGPGSVSPDMFKRICAAIPLLLWCALAPAATLPEIDAEIARIRSQHGVAGVAAVVVDRDAIVLQHYSGVQNWDTAVPVTAATWFRAGSVTKVFTGLALLAAQRQGHIDIDAPVAAQLPPRPPGEDLPFQNPWEAEHPLYVADLMEHTAGWFDMSRAEFGSQDPAPLTLERALAVRPQSRRSHWPPGMHSVYSNSGPGMAAWLVERRSGESFDQLMQKTVFGPLGMDASLRLEPSMEDTLATGYDTDGVSVIPYWHILYRPSGGLNLRPLAMARFLQMMLNGGRLDGRQVFSAAQLHRLQTPTRSLAARAGMKFGYGLGIYTSIHRGHVLYGHGGDGDGYLAHFAYSLESGRGYFVVINAFSHPPLRALKTLLADALIQNLAPLEAPPVAPLALPLLEKYSGTYHLAATRFPAANWRERSMRITLQQGALLVHHQGGQDHRIVPLGSQLFRRPGEPVATRAFIQLENGSIVYQEPDDNWLKQ